MGVETEFPQAVSKKNIMVLFGGCEDHERSVNAASGIVSGISDAKYNVVPVYITKEGKWLLYDGFTDNVRNVNWEKFGTQAVFCLDRVNGGLLRIVGDRARNIPVDVVFPLLYGNDGASRGLLELSGVPYVGCGLSASAVASDRGYARAIAAALGVNQVKHIAFSGCEVADMDECVKKIGLKRIGYPYIVKPAAVGISEASEAHNRKSLEAAIRRAFEFDGRVIVEAKSEGRELWCGIIGSPFEAKVSAVGELIPAEDAESAAPRVAVPAELPDGIADEVRDTALKLYRAFNCGGFAAVGFQLEPDNKLFYNEINTMPDLGSISIYSAIWKASGVEHEALIDGLIDAAFEG